jgi:uncharacterized membrane protein YcaP (DUF421 family)
MRPLEESMDKLFLDDWSDVVRTVAIGVLAYAVLIFLLRVSGKRTLSKMNAFDFIVTIALGSTLATILLNKDVALAEGTTALALLIALQYAVTWSSVRIAWVKRLVTGEPSMLLYQGHLLPDALRKVRVTEEEVRAAVRRSGLPALEMAQAVVLETDGSMTVIERKDGQASESALEGVKGADADADADARSAAR